MSNVVVHEWLPVSLSDVGINGCEVGCCLVDVGDRRGKVLGLVIQHACCNVRRVWLGTSATVNM
jgi:hypothetical protein